MRILILPNLEKTGGADCTRRVVAALSELGITPMLDAMHRELAWGHGGCVVGEREELLASCDILLTIGGDGTILRAVQDALVAEKPLLGVNTGRVGFLTQLEPNELGYLALLREGRYGLVRRMLLDVEIMREDGGEIHTALNDAVLLRGSAKMVELDVSCDGIPVVRHRADGLIFSTPTGSTAYSYSAGGSIAEPELELMLMTAICPHSKFNHSLILSPERRYLARETDSNNRDGLLLSIDGRRVCELRNGEYITVTKSRCAVEFIDFHIRDFYSRVDEKLSFRR